MTTTVEIPTQQTDAWKRENLPDGNPGARGFEKWCQPPKYQTASTNLQDVEASEEFPEPSTYDSAPSSNDPQPWVPKPNLTLAEQPESRFTSEEPRVTTSTQPLLSILIPTVVARKKTFDALMRMLNAQRNALPNPELVEILTFCDDGKMMVGAKRNKLLDMATGRWLAYADDDDRVFQII